MKPFIRPKPSTLPPTIEELEIALVALAELIEVHGDGALCIFEYLERELEAAKKKAATLARVRALTGSANAVQNAQQTA